MSCRTKIIGAGITIGIFSTLFIGPARSQQDQFQDGLKLFEKKNYKAASECFEHSLSVCPQDANVLYYLAVSCQKCGKVKRAHQLFEHLINSFPNTNAAELSKTFIEYEDKQLTAIGATASAGQNSHPLPSPELSVPATEAASLPAQEKIEFERHGDRLVIKAQINNRPIQAYFDSGAPSTFISLSAYQSLNMAAPSGPPTGSVAGPNGDVLASWEASVSVKVGNIVRANYPVVVVDDPNASKNGNDLPTLGQAFFKSYNYTIDEQGKTILLTKTGFEGGATGVSTAISDPWAVPFSLQGRQMIVKVEVNGKPVEMLFDASSYFIAFNAKTIRDLHLPFAGEGQPGMEASVPGLGEFEVESIRLGPITKKNIHVLAMSDSALMTPLLGQPFFSDYRYTIDNDHNLIHFLKR